MFTIVDFLPIQVTFIQPQLIFMQRLITKKLGENYSLVCEVNVDYFIGGGKNILIKEKTTETLSNEWIR